MIQVRDEEFTNEEFMNLSSEESLRRFSKC
jgi:hypothetical protein